MNRSRKLSHFDGSGQAHMVNVGDKPETHRVARASGTIRMAPSTLKLVLAGRAEKGDVLGVARVAAIQADVPQSAKMTDSGGLFAQYNPLCIAAARDRADLVIWPETTPMLCAAGRSCVPG